MTTAVPDHEARTRAVPDEDIQEDTGWELFPAYCMTEEATGILTQQAVHPAFFGARATGNLIHVIVEENPEKYDLIHIPDTVHKPPAGVGYVVGVGPMAGNRKYMEMGGVASIGPIVKDPRDLLGMHAFFGAHTGIPLHYSMLDRKFEAAIIQMVSRDITAYDLDRINLVQRLQAKLREDNEASAKLIVEA